LRASAPDAGAGGEAQEGQSFDKLRTNGERVSRRAVLGAVAAVPLMGASPRNCERSEAIQAAAEGGLPRRFAPRDDAEKWRRALAAYRTAEAEVRGFERATAGSSFEAAERFEGLHGELGDAMYSALRLLLEAPAPDVAALAVKIELVVEHEVATLEGGEGYLAAIAREARVLAGVTP
jgi:hypothetical protein